MGVELGIFTFEAFEVIKNKKTTDKTGLEGSQAKWKVYKIPLNSHHGSLCPP